MEAIELTQERMQEMVNLKKEEIQNIISLPYDQFKNYLRDSVIRTNIIMEGFESTDESIGLYESILFIGVMSLRETVNNTLQWLEKNAIKVPKKESEDTETEL